MQNKDLIICLIQQDLKHNQLIRGLRHMGLDDQGLHSLDLLSIVARLMDLPENTAAEQWQDIYGGFMSEAHKIPCSDLGEELWPVAEACYLALCNYVLD
jgi:hypothetical protein